MAVLKIDDDLGRTLVFGRPPRRIVTPLKDRIESQILTHYPKNIETALAITEQEADIHVEQKGRVIVSDLVKRLIEQVSFEARSSEYVDKKSGVSARLTIAAFENAVSAAERRAVDQAVQRHARFLESDASS